ncbi:uncharacterized protein [Diabrotica undecimpunctata]|uniref:uncharacterized protein n=1 Tax=Diabrotica undecimpunctata TaxID=50387 RepID=UPI003B63E189
MTSMRVLLCILFFILGVNSFKVDYNQLDGMIDVNNNYGLNEDYYETLNENVNYENENYELNGNEVLDTREKKSPAVCTVKKVLRTHPQDGYEYHPKHYHEYECVPVPKGIIDVDFSDQDICVVQHTECITVEKNLLFARQLMAIPSPTCGMEPHERPVKVGCNCMHHVKHRFR